MQIDALRPWTRVSQTFAICAHPFFFLLMVTRSIIIGECARSSKLSLEMYCVNINFKDDANSFVIFLGILCFDLDDTIRRIIVEDSIKFVDI